MGPQGVIIMLIVAFGGLLYLFRQIWNNQENKLFKSFTLKNNVTKIELTLFIILVIVFLVSFGKTLYFVNELLFFIIAYIFYDMTKNIDIPDMKLHILFFAWFMALFIFSSIFVIKDNRYFLLMAPSVAYFMILGLNAV